MIILLKSGFDATGHHDRALDLFPHEEFSGGFNHAVMDSFCGGMFATFVGSR